jgi:hypothetical protein
MTTAATFIVEFALCYAALHALAFVTDMAFRR